MSKKMTVEEFTLQAIRNLRNLDKSRGIHVVYSGFNQAFKQYFPGKDPRKEMDILTKSGLINLVPRRGGPMIYIAGEGPKKNLSGEEALHRILNT